MHSEFELMVDTIAKYISINDNILILEGSTPSYFLDLGIRVIDDKSVTDIIYHKADDFNLLLLLIFSYLAMFILSLWI